MLAGLWLFFTPGQAQDDNIYRLNHIVEVRLQFEEENWHDILDSLKEAGNDERLIAAVAIDGKDYEEVGVRYKGNSSYFNVRNDELRKLPFNIKINFTDKKQRLPGGFRTLKLSNAFRDPSFLREVLSYEIANKYMPSPSANYARVYANDEYLGFYNLTESVDDDFLEYYYGDDKGVFFKCDPNWHGESYGHCPEGNNASLQFLGRDSVCYFQLYEIKSDNGWRELIDLTHRINQQPNRLDEIMNIDEALWMLAFDNVLVNLDSYIGRLCHNYYLYLDEYGIWHPIIWDMNLSFGGFRYTGIGAPLSNEKMQEMSMFLHFIDDNKQRPLVLNLLQNDHYRKIYLAHVKTIVEENFANGWYKERAAEIRELINEEVSRDPNLLYSVEAYEQNLDTTVQIGNSSIIGITELMEPRAAYILNHPLMQKEQPTISDIGHQRENGEAMVTATITGAEEVWVYHRPDRYRPWTRQPMARSEDGTQWSATIPAEDDTQYYLVAENARTVRLSPERASYEFYELAEK